MNSVSNKAANIRLVVFDVDGVLTDGRLILGDALLDLPAMAESGLAIAVAAAHVLVRERADWVTEHRGGRGAVREVCEYILRAQDKLEDLCRPYLK